ncbi:transposase [Streptomyces sp. SID8352]|uniref:transposase n=1 Tax=Streptomyces sp. SID8352 TaxID=2690338 RepID=UPI001367C542|nr:transposase [Streptomyces sp. SID8352]MYU24040.1 transposase [Streptomyces sp. SID8352]
MSKRYTAEFKRDAIALVRSSPHRNVTEIARELGVGPEGLRGWVKQAKTDEDEAARADVFRFIEVEYNRTRLRKHPEFGYFTPLETRARLQHGFAPAA